MKEAFIKEGGYKVHGTDLEWLQDGSLLAVQDWFEKYGAFKLSGADITPNGADFDISTGLFFIQHADGYKLCRMAAQVAVALPGYVKVDKSTITKNYTDQGVDDAFYEYTATFVAGAPPVVNDDRYLVIDNTLPEPVITIEEAIAASNMSKELDLAGVTTGIVTVNNLKLRVNKASKLLYIYGSVTIGNFNLISGNDYNVALAAPAQVPAYYRPATRQRFTGYVEDPTPLVPSNLYKKDTNSLDYVSKFNAYIDTNGTISVRFVKPSGVSTQVIEFSAVVPLL